MGTLERPCHPHLPGREVQATGSCSGETLCLHSSEGRLDKGCFWGVHVNATQAMLSARVYVCLYSVGGWDGR